MAFYLDDDDDGYLPSPQNGRPSGASFFSLSQESSMGGLQLSQSQQSPFSAPQFSQELGSQSPTAARDYDAPTVDFICRNCGSRDAYLDETTNDIICNVCFTQSQTHVDSSQQQFDYDDAVNMAHKGRDGRLQTTRQSLPGKAKGPIGSRAKPLSEYDNTKRQPPLPECLAGFQTVMQSSCKIVCRDLLHIPSIVKSTDDADEEPDDCPDQQARKKQVTTQVLNTVRDLWKAYLWSWHEGAEYYGAIYPQVRFSFRDYFLQNSVKGMLYQTLAAKAAKELKRKIQQEGNNDDGSDGNDDNDGGDDDDDDDDGSGQKMDDATHRSDLSSLNDADVPLNFVAPSTNKKKTSAKKRASHQKEQQCRKRGRKRNSDEPELVGDSDSEIVLPNEDSDVFSTAQSASVDNDDDINTVISDISQGATSKGDSFVRSNTMAKLIYFHTTKISKEAKDLKGAKQKEGETRKRSWNQQPQLGRKEAALIMQPNLLMIMSMILIATSTYGVSEADVLRWVQNGSLPLLNAYDSLLSPLQRDALSPIAMFFRLHTLPTMASLLRITASIHVACGYKPPPVQLKQKRSTGRASLNDKALTAPGRIIRPSNIPLVLANLIRDLGLSQQVLNYSLSLMGYHVAKQTLAASDLMDEAETEWLPLTLSRARPDRVNDLNKILAVVLVACKLIPGWHIGLEYTIGKTNKKSSLAGRPSLKGESGWIPWDQEHFRQVANGETERDYLTFLETTVMRSNKYVLPEFIEALEKDPKSTNTDESLSSSAVYASMVLIRNASPVFGRAKAGGDDKSSYAEDSSEKEVKHSKPRSNAKQMEEHIYELTRRDETSVTHALHYPLGPLIEYFAYKTASQADKILDYLVTLDDEMRRCCKGAVKPIAVSPDEAFDLILPTNGKKKKKDVVERKISFI